MAAARDTAGGLEDTRRTIPRAEQVPADRSAGPLEARPEQSVEMSPRRAVVGGATSAAPSRAAGMLPRLRRTLASRAATRQALILSEILGPPKALRQPDDR